MFESVHFILSDLTSGSDMSHVSKGFSFFLFFFSLYVGCSFILALANATGRQVQGAGVTLGGFLKEGGGGCHSVRDETDLYFLLYSSSSSV